MNKPPDSTSDSDDSDTPPHSKTRFNPILKQSKVNKYKPNIK